MSLLEVTGVSKRFGGIAALRDVSVSVDAREAVGLVGPNGAGKTTLFNCVLGVLRPDGGHVEFSGRPLLGLPAYRRARLGIGRTFQRLELFAGMTVREHLLVAERARRGDGGLVRDLLNRGGPSSDESARVAEIVDLLGLRTVAGHPVESLPLGHGRLVELGRALMTEPALLLLDEPSSGLDRVESLGLAGVLRSVIQERGTAVLLVEHDLEVVRRVVGRLYVLDFGEVIAEGEPEDVMSRPEVRRAYLGVA
jgi:branched-chain amino acid transport system ATP-binding protein